ncbi:trihelix transcription factor GTL2 isoform X1 [Cucurbita pepo subsp. pepo]|uniref:trihelix transcription factor GTL2 isoform X1 n=1 Tax=Cucurbita pepo subsp. pepo TaxID=3664 RepID=UPI000C9D62D4|nr:trihelix transcription factor GTL2 isoform X1 [Cucurbita pepo subsp. pepo]
MFEGSVSEQLHQFLAPRTTTTTTTTTATPPNSNSLPFLLHSPNFNFHSFDSYDPSSNHPLVHQSSENDNETTTMANLSVAMDLEDHHRHNHHNQWSNDELLALLRIRSNIDNCFPESTWEHVSRYRKLGEVGFTRTPDKCKEKFEDESRYFNHINYNKTCMFLTHELNYHQETEDRGAVVVVPEEAKHEKGNDNNDNNDDNDDNDEQQQSSSKSKRKRKTRTTRQREFEVLKGYCEDIVKNMMIQQEEIHSKLLHEMLKREEEKIAKEECWKKQQMERFHKELQMMAQEQAIASDRQATMIEILNQISISNPFSSSKSKKDLQNLLHSLNHHHNNNNNLPNSPSSSSLIQTQNPKNPSSSTRILPPQDPNSNPPPFSIQKLPQNPKSREKEVDDLGKRWPRDEVLALVNVRCSLYDNSNNNNSNSDQDKSGGTDQATLPKAPLWERISQGMLQLGYKRSAKRCKEKWENINKYFRKTKDVNKKRSIDSRTCPYFHQLSTLYNQGGNRSMENLPDNVVGKPL